MAIEQCEMDGRESLYCDVYTSWQYNNPIYFTHERPALV